MKKSFILLVFSFALLFSAQEIHSQTPITDQKATERVNELKSVVNLNKAKQEEAYLAFNTYETKLQALEGSMTKKDKSKDKSKRSSELKKLKYALDAALQEFLTPEEFLKYQGIGAQ